jgi:hypothetical protein
MVMVSLNKAVYTIVSSLLSNYYSLRWELLDKCLFLCVAETNNTIPIVTIGGAVGGGVALIVIIIITNSVVVIIRRRKDKQPTESNGTGNTIAVYYSIIHISKYFN